MKPKAIILVCDDDLAVRSSLSFLFAKAGYEVICKATPDEILKEARQQKVDLALLDMNYSSNITGDEGLELLQKIKVFQPSVPVILMTAWGSVDLAVQGMKLGAADFITKPWNNLQLLRTVETSIMLASPAGDSEMQSNQNADRREFPGIIGRDPKIQSILDLVLRVAPTNAPILITGESGTGKELIAEAIHHHSTRKTGPFVKVNLGGLTSSLFESEMFGHKKGAFTDAHSDRKGRFEHADKGTIFLDEIGELDLNTQVKLLRVLQDQTFERLGDSTSTSVDVRIISATNRNLAQEVANKSFREDLFYRINLVHIEIPPLRKRPNDIPLLAEWFIKQAEKSYQRPSKSLEKSAIEWLQNQLWPGNIRELKNMVERTALYSQNNRLTANDFQSAINPGFPLPSKDSPDTVTTISEMESDMIRHGIRDYGPNLTQVAKKLGISRATLYRKMEKYGIRHETEG